MSQDMKEKVNYNPLQLYLNKIRLSFKHIIYALLSISILYFFIYFAQMIGEDRFDISHYVKLSKDRAKSYRVKVLPAHLSDDELDKLPPDSFSYLAMIDAGSSGCRAHIYRYGKLGDISGPLYVLPQHDSKKIKPGLSSFEHSPENAGVSLQGLVEFIKSQVPESDWSVTPVWLKATAGLRLLDEKKSEKILESVRSFLMSKSNSPFVFRPSWARVISGNEEGGFGWIAFNYLKKIIGPKKNKENSEAPYAVVEMGGASSQVSQIAPSLEEANKIPKEYKFSFEIEGDHFHLYTHSYLGFGAEQGREQLNKIITKTIETSENNVVKDPCLNKGYVRPSSTPRKEPYEGPQGIYYNVTGSSHAETGICPNILKSIFGHHENGNGEKDASDSPLSRCGLIKLIQYITFNCVYQPSFVLDSINFLVFENFYYMSSALGVEGKSPSNERYPLLTTPHNILEASHQVCSADWDTLQSTYPKDSQSKDVNKKMCFVSSFAYSFLVHGLKIPNNKTLTIQKEVGNSEIEWALGAAYKEAAGFLKRSNLRPT